MPTLTRFLAFVAICAAIVYVTAFALANFVQPTRVEERIELPIQDLLKRAEQRERQSSPAAPPRQEGAGNGGDESGAVAAEDSGAGQ